MTDEGKFTPDPADLGRMIGMAGNAQLEGMQALLTEMQALTAALPGLTAADGRDHRSEAEIRAIEAEVEASFDNMPV